MIAFAFIAFAPVSAMLLADSDAPAQQRGNPPRGGAAARPPPPKRAPTTGDGGAPAPTASAMPTGATAPPAKDTTDSGVVAMTRTDGGSQTIRFGELEIEGRLKSPQLIYFLRRVRAEFAAGDLGHRTFMGELSETRKDPSF
jgi:hypothetical protein